MNFFKEGKTNWKYILIVVILAILVGGGILGYQYWWAPKEETKIPELKTPGAIEKVEIPEEVTPYIKVISPNGGENWLVGKTYDISWESRGIDKININLIEHVICPPGALCEAPFLIDIASNISANLGKYSWTIPDYTKIGFYGSQFIIRILTIQPEDIKINDVSDNYFSIIEGENQ